MEWNANIALEYTYILYILSIHKEKSLFFEVEQGVDEWTGMRKYSWTVIIKWSPQYLRAEQHHRTWVTQSNIYVLYVHMYVHTYIHTYKKNNIHTVHTCGEEAPRLRNGCHIASGEPIQTMSFHVVVHRGMYCNTDHAIKEGRNICITLMYVCTYVYIFVQVNVWTYIIYMCVFCIFMCVCMRAWYARTYLCMYYVKNRKFFLL